MPHYIITLYVAPHITLYNVYLYNKRCNFDFFVEKLNFSTSMMKIMTSQSVFEYISGIFTV